MTTMTICGDCCIFSSWYISLARKKLKTINLHSPPPSPPPPPPPPHPSFPRTPCILLCLHSACSPAQTRILLHVQPHPTDLINSLTSKPVLHYASDSLKGFQFVVDITSYENFIRGEKKTFFEMVKTKIGCHPKTQSLVMVLLLYDK